MCCLLVFLCISAQHSSAYTATAQERLYPQITDPQWKLLDCMERIETCQIPSRALNKMSTEELVDAVILCPLRADFFLFDTFGEGFDKVYSEFNGLRALLGKDDVGDCLLSKYRSIDLDDEAKAIDLMVIELLLAQESVIAHCDEITLKDIEYEVLAKYELQNEQAGERHFRLYFNALNEKKGNTITSYIPGTVLTPAGTVIDVRCYTTDLSPAQKKELENTVKTLYPNVTILKPATLKYNCHSYAWFSSSPYNCNWMSYPWHIVTKKGYMNDGSYSKQIAPKKGLKAFYPGTGNEHTGVVVGVTNMSVVVTSKWGAGPLVAHHYFDCPYYYSGCVITFWKANTSLPPLR